jgi:quercetin dioxygenase-like cupin family protein
MTHLRNAGSGSKGSPQEVTNLRGAAAELLEDARNAAAGRAARTLVPGAHAPLKQTLFALTSGQSLADHDTPTAAALQVLAGRVRLVAGDRELYLGEGDHTAVPPVRHRLDSVDDAVVLLTVTP